MGDTAVVVPATDLAGAFELGTTMGADPLGAAEQAPAATVQSNIASSRA
ncbi:MAG: hypothetical protein ABJA16_02905 [Nakamurella sp.]